MVHVVRDVVVLNVEFVDPVLVTQFHNFIDDVLHTAPAELLAPKVRGCAEGAVCGTSATGVELPDPRANSVRRLVRLDLEVLLHVVVVPGGERDMVQLACHAQQGRGLPNLGALRAFGADEGEFRLAADLPVAVTQVDAEDVLFAYVYAEILQSQPAGELSLPE